MGVVLPGESHPTENLDAPLRAIGVCIEHQRPCQHRRHVGLLALRCTRRVPSESRHLLDRDEHVRETVLDRLELTYGTAELPSILRVLSSSLEAPTRPSRALGRREHEHQPAHHRVGHSTEHLLGWYLGPFHLQGRDASGEVETCVRLGFRRGNAGEEHHPRDVACRSPGRRDDQSGKIAHQQRGDTTRHGQTSGPGLDNAQLARSGKYHGPGRRPVDQAGQQFCSGVLVTSPLDERRSEDRRKERTRRDRTCQFLCDHRQLQETSALAAMLLCDVQAQPTLLAQTLPEGRHRLPLFVEHVRGARHVGSKSRASVSPTASTSRDALQWLSATPCPPHDGPLKMAP